MGHPMRLEFTHWVPHSHSLGPHRFSDESNKLETYTYVRTKKIILLNTNLLMGLFIFKYLLFSFLGPKKKKKKKCSYIYICADS